MERQQTIECARATRWQILSKAREDLILQAGFLLGNLGLNSATIPSEKGTPVRMEIEFSQELLLQEQVRFLRPDGSRIPHKEIPLSWAASLIDKIAKL